MKKLTTLVISCSLALAAGAMAQQDDAQTSPTPNKQQHHQQQRQQRRAAREARQANRDQTAPAATSPSRARAAMKNNASAAETTTPAKAKADVNAKTAAEQRQEKRAARKEATANKGNNAASLKAETNAPAQTNAGANATTTTPNRRPNKGKAKKPDTQVVQKIKQQHQNFHAQARPQQVPSVTFNESYRITNSQNWQGERYAAFRDYHPERHDQRWYHSHYNRIELIGGGYYYWNNGYWYPAWGYNPAQSYYVYNGPIYTGSQAEPPDRVIADVQATLQEMGYYKGEVDGLLGPLTRQALTEYQSDNGLYSTAAIDEPTLNSLGMGS